MIELRVGMVSPLFTAWIAIVMCLHFDSMSGTHTVFECIYTSSSVPRDQQALRLGDMSDPRSRRRLTMIDTSSVREWMPLPVCNAPLVLIVLCGT